MRALRLVLLVLVAAALLACGESALPKQQPAQQARFSGRDLVAAGREMLARQQERQSKVSSAEDGADDADVKTRRMQSTRNAPASADAVEQVFDTFQPCAEAYEMGATYRCVQSVLLPVYMDGYAADRCEASSEGVLGEDAQSNILALVEEFVDNPSLKPDIDDCKALFSENNHLGQCIATLDMATLGSFLFAASLNNYGDQAEACAPVAEVGSYVNATLVDESCDMTSIPGIGANSTESTAALLKMHDLASDCEELSAGITTSAYPSPAGPRPRSWLVSSAILTLFVLFLSGSFCSP